MINDYINSAYRVGFSLDRQFPATPFGVYMLDIILNGAPVAGSPFAVRVDPGPVYGPNCEITGLTSSDTSVLSGGVNEKLSFEVVARDRFGNRQVYSDRAEQWTIEIVVVKGANLGQATVIKVPLCTPPPSKHTHTHTHDQRPPNDGCSLCVLPATEPWQLPTAEHGSPVPLPFALLLPPGMHSKHARCSGLCVHD